MYKLNVSGNMKDSCYRFGFNLAIVNPRTSKSIPPIILSRYLFCKLQKLYSDFELQGVPHEELASKTYHMVCNRLSVSQLSQLMRLYSNTSTISISYNIHIGSLIDAMTKELNSLL